MKRITLLFLALSSLALAGVKTTIGPNSNSTETTAGINVNVSAIVTATDTELVITDSTGTPISEVDFNHILTAGEVTGQGEQSLTADLRVKGSALAPTGTLSTLFGNGTLTLTNGTSSLTTNLTATPGAIASNREASLSVISALSGEAVVGNYATQTTTLTVTYNKTAK